MNKETAIKIVEAVNPELTSLAETMTKVNEVLEVNNGNILDMYPQSEIQYAKFVDILRTKDDEVRHMVIIAGYLTLVYQDLHIKLQTFEEPLSPREIKDAVTLIKILRKYDLLYLITDGLTDKTLNILQRLEDEFSETIGEV